MKTFRTIIAFFQALLPFCGFVLISIIIYAKVTPPFNIILVIVVMILGVFASRSIFNMIRKRGYISTMSIGEASSDLDDLDPVEGDGVLKMSPEELVSNFNENKVLFRKYSISIWGDEQGRKLRDKHTLKAIEFDLEKNILSIYFQDNCLLKIKNPRLIFHTENYLKIVKAKEVLWQIPTNTNTTNQSNYLNTGKHIKTRSNSNWKPHSLDIGLGMQAVYLQG